MGSLAYGASVRRGKLTALASASLLASVTPLAAEEVVIAALGDSLTQGYGLVQEDGFVPQMQAWLQARGHDVRLINAGVSGDTTAGGLARAAWTLTEDVDGMIVTLGGNDLLRAIPPEASRSNLAGILDFAAGADVEVLLVGMTAPGNYGPDFQQAFDAMYPELAAEYGTLYAESFFGGFDGDAESDPGSVLDLMQADGIHPNASGVAVIVDALGPQVEALIAAIAAD